MSTLIINGREVNGWRKVRALSGGAVALFVSVVFILAIIAGASTVALAAVTSPIWIVAKMLRVA